MANGDIPVTGSAVIGSGSQATFTINATNALGDFLDHLRVRTQGTPLHIHVENGGGKNFDADLISPGWRLEITARPGSSGRPSTKRSPTKRRGSFGRPSSKKSAKKKTK